jgi:glycogen synthase
MKLLIYSHFFAPSIGGVENVVMSLARGLAEASSQDGTPEFEVTLVTETPAGDFDDGLLSFRVVRQPKFQTLLQLFRGVDLVHLCGPALLPLFLAWLLGKPAVIEHHGYQAICLNGLLLHRPGNTACPGHFQAGHYMECLRCEKQESSGLRSLIRLLLMFPRLFLSRKAARNLAITNHVLERHALPRSSVIYYGIEDPLPKGPDSACATPAPEKVWFAYVGRLVPEKGIPVLLEAARTLREKGEPFQIRLIGDGPERARLEATIARNGLESCVFLTGALSGAALGDALREVSVVVMPSVWEETAGLAAIEQMMRGKLVIASDIGGLGEIVRDAGLKCTPGIAAELATRMEQVLQNTSLVDSLGGRARERALHLFARGRMIEEHARVYHEVLRKRMSEA